MSHKQPPLPPPGHERKEILKQRTDNLEQQAEELAASQEVYTIDPGKFEEIRELQDAIMKGALDVSGRQSDYEYCWVPTGNHGNMIWAKKRLGWETVHADMPEAKEYTAEDSSRRIGDVLLMRIPLKRFLEIEAYEKYKADRRIQGVYADFEEMGRKVRDKGIIVHTDNDDLAKVAAARSAPGQQAARAAFQQAAARTVAQGVLNDKLREGSVPGLPVGA
jgi:hypothetical protein